LDLNTDVLTTLASFNSTDGANPAASLILSGSTLYGTTLSGGTNGDGTVFSINLAPEPSIGSMLVIGLAVLAFWRARRYEMRAKPSRAGR
jgi:uncharacterized repeat protein (TIGR03803 family)